MKRLTNVIFLLSFLNFYSQYNYEKMPNNAEEIYFEYESKSNFHYDEIGIYGDTLLFKQELPNVEYIKSKHPIRNHICGFLSFSNMGFKTKSKVASILYHNNESYAAVYNFKNNTTTIVAKRNDEKLKILFKKTLKTNYNNFTYRIYLDYQNQTKKTFYPNVDYNDKFEKTLQKIEWSDSLKGTFIEKNNNLVLKNTVKINQDLPKQITFGLVFENNNYGIIKVDSLYKTYELKSVSYK